MSPTRRRNRPVALAIVATAAAAAAALSGREVLGFIAGVRHGRAERCKLVVRTAEGPQQWQRGLDTALLDVDATPRQRLQGLVDALASPGDVLESVSAAASAIREQGLRKGHPAALDALFPKGTLARSDLEGLAALARQAPEAINELRDADQGVRSKTPTSASDETRDPSAVADRLMKLLSPDALAEAAEEAGNIFRRTPRGLESPTFDVVSSSDGYELRRYRPFTVAKKEMSPQAAEGFASAEGFNALAGYLFGGNEQKRAMKMTMPVEIEYNAATNDGRTMSFVLPSEDVSDDGGAPRPLDESVEVAAVPERLVAVREFPGVATTDEVRRQADKLRAALADEGAFAPVAKDEYSVLQYNPPYTLPWRRRNEIAIVVTENALASPSMKEADVFPGEANDSGKDIKLGTSTVDSDVEAATTVSMTTTPLPSADVAFPAATSDESPPA